MKKEDLRVAVHGAQNDEGGIYNVLSSFSTGLMEGFKNIGINSDSSYDCVTDNKDFQVSIGFNITLENTWEYLMSKGILNMMWTVDSVFFKNYPIIKKHSENPNFVVLDTYDDNEPVSEFLPNLKFIYLPHATNLNLWKKTTDDKDIPISMFSSVCDIDATFVRLKEGLKPDIYKIFTDFYDLATSQSNMKLFDLYKIFCKHSSLPYNGEFYSFLVQEITPLIVANDKINAVKALKDFPVKVYGNDNWLKYISPKQEYCGAAELKKSIDLMSRSKITIHSHQPQIGLHERILNASAVETFVLSSDVQTIKDEFKDSMDYYNFENLAEKAEYYLTHEKERQEKALTARNIVAEKHTWDIRAKQICDMLI